METAHSYKKDPPAPPTGGNLSADSLAGIYKRLLQGAWVRSGASVFMWVFGLIAYLQEMIGRFAFLGISITVLYLILINPPTLWILKGIRQKKSVAALSLGIHGLEIFGYTAIIYFAGGMGRGYLTLLYAALITYVGVMSPRSWPFIITAACTLSLSGVIALEYFKLIPDTALPLRHPIPYSQQLLDVAIMTSGFLVVAFISSYTSGLLRRGRQEMKEQNEELRETRDRVEQARHTLEEKNLALERATDRAQSSDRKKSEFLSNMSHELRTPLNHIIGFSEMLCDRAFGELNPAQEETLGDILQSSRHLLSLINEVLDLSKVEAGKMELKYSSIRLKELMENSLVVVKEKALKHGINLSTGDPRPAGDHRGRRTQAETDPLQPAFQRREIYPRRGNGAGAGGVGKRRRPRVPGSAVQRHRYGNRTESRRPGADLPALRTGGQFGRPPLSRDRSGAGPD